MYSRQDRKTHHWIPLEQVSHFSNGTYLCLDWSPSCISILSNQWAMNSVLLFQPWGGMSSQTWISLAYIFSGCADAPWRKPKCFTSLSVVFPVSATYSQALLQGLKLGPFVLTNVTTCKLFLAQKSSLRDLIFGLVSPARARTRAGACPPSTLPSLAGQPVLVLNSLAWLWLS